MYKTSNIKATFPPQPIWIGLDWMKLWPVLVYRFTAVYWVIASPAGPTGLASGHTLSNKRLYPLHDRFASNNYILYQLQQLHWRRITASRKIGGQELKNLSAWQIQLASWRTRPFPSTCWMSLLGIYSIF